MRYCREGHGLSWLVGGLLSSRGGRGDAVRMGLDARRWGAKPSSRGLVGAAIEALRQHGDLIRNAGSLLATTGLSSAMGFAYWAVAARLFSQSSVGYGSATISAVSLLGTIGMFGLNTVLIGELPKRDRKGNLVAAALLATGLGSLVLGLGFTLIAPGFNPRFAAIVGTPMRAVLVAFSVVPMAVGLVFDQATIGVMRGGVQLFRNFIFSLGKLLLLPIAAIVLHDEFGTGIIASYAVGMTLSLAAAALQLQRSGTRVLRRPDWMVLRGLGRAAFVHNWLNLAIVVPYSLIPVVVTIVVSPTANAAFFAAWMLASFVYLIPQHLSTVLFAVASAEPHAMAQKLRFTLKISVLLGLPASIVLALGAHWELGFFGVGYSRLATFPLVLLALGYLPCIPKVHYVAVCRAIGKVNRAAVVLTTFAVAEVGMAVLGGYLHGLVGLSVALLIVAVVEGAATTPAIVKTATARSPRLHGSPGIGPSSSSRLSSLQGLSPATGTAAEGRTSDYWTHKAQQEAGLAVLLSLATTLKPDQPFGLLQTPQRLRLPGDDERPVSDAEEFMSIYLGLRSSVNRYFREDQGDKRLARTAPYVNTSDAEPDHSLKVAQTIIQPERTSVIEYITDPAAHQTLCHYLGHEVAGNTVFRAAAKGPKITKQSYLMVDDDNAQ